MFLMNNGNDTIADTMPPFIAAKLCPGADTLHTSFIYGADIKDVTRVGTTQVEKS